MQRKLRLFLPVLLLVSAAAATARAQDGTNTPAAGSPERKAIADALRAPVERELKQKVIFKIDHLKLKDGWAFLRGVPQKPGGGEVDYNSTPYAQRIKDGVFDDGIVALLRRKAGKWQVVKYVIGATDVPYVTWDKDYKAPSAIFD
jgi:hypothetical protein